MASLYSEQFLWLRHSWSLRIAVPVLVGTCGLSCQEEPARSYGQPNESTGREGTFGDAAVLDAGPDTGAVSDEPTMAWSDAAASEYAGDASEVDHPHASDEPEGDTRDERDAASSSTSLADTSSSEPSAQLNPAVPTGRVCCCGRHNGRGSEV